MTEVTIAYEVPTGSRLLLGRAEAPNYVDSFRMELPAGEPLSIDFLAFRIFSLSTWWLDGLLWLRNALVSLVGLRRGDLRAPSDAPRDLRFELGQKAPVFLLLDRTEEELVMGEEDSHLDFRVSLWKRERADGITSVELTTAVWYKNRLGVTYFAVVKPFHRRIVSTLMRRAAPRLRA